MRKPESRAFRLHVQARQHDAELQPDPFFVADLPLCQREHEAFFVDDGVLIDDLEHDGRRKWHVGCRQVGRTRNCHGLSIPLRLPFSHVDERTSISLCRGHVRDTLLAVLLHAPDWRRDQKHLFTCFSDRAHFYISAFATGRDVEVACDDVCIIFLGDFPEQAQQLLSRLHHLECISTMLPLQMPPAFGVWKPLHFLFVEAVLTSVMFTIPLTPFTSQR